MVKHDSLPVVACDAPSCVNGFTGLFTKMPCFKCGGVGWLDAETREAITDKLSLAALEHIKQLEQENRALTEQIAKIRAKQADDGLNPYRGMSKRLGGNYRMD